MTTINRRLVNEPDGETLNILLELGEMVAAGTKPTFQLAPDDLNATRAGLLSAAASAILSVKAVQDLQRGNTRRRVVEGGLV